LAEHLVLYTTRSGTEMLVSQINTVHDAFIVEVEHCGGSAIRFAGD
jgi:hypothetical protein